jgi:hypothetical protein
MSEDRETECLELCEEAFDAPCEDLPPSRRRFFGSLAGFGLALPLAATNLRAQDSCCGDGCQDCGEAANCQDACQGECQTCGEGANCEGGCEGVCQNCGQEAACQGVCIGVCEASCEASPQSCYAQCEVSCEGWCEVYCEDWCQLYGEGSC